jgi:hypothetical protein
MKIIDDFLLKEEFNNIKEKILSDYFPWYFNDGVVIKNDDYFQFTHIMYIDDKPNSEFFNLMETIISKLNILTLIRIKVNLQTRTNKIIEQGMHTDHNYTGYEKMKSAIFYLNTNNGYTKFNDKKIIHSKENRIVIFNAKIKHTGSSCTDKKNRVAINLNYVEK